jgi:hypothetical protein
MMGESTRGESLFGSFSSGKERNILLFLKKKKQQDFCFFGAARAVVAAFGIFVAHAGFAQEQPVDPARLKAAKDIAHVTSNADRLKQMLDTMRPGLVRVFVSQDHLAPDAANKLFDTIFVPSFQAHYGDLVTARAKILAGIFTVPEMTQIRDFYASPVGQKYVANEGVIAAGMAAAMQPFLRDVMKQAMDFAKVQTLPKVQGP